MASNAQDQFRATKRKLDDAFLELDNSVINPELEDNPHPPKRSNTSRSLYATLAKYGISANASPHSSQTSTPPGLTKPTPHLTAILNRATTRTRNLFSFRSNKPSTGSVLSSTTDYRPSSITSFLSRLSTFKLATYANKPSQIDAVASAKCGWTNDGKDRLLCGICGASWVVVGREGMSREAGNTLLEKQRISLVESHKQGCPWRTRQCDPSIYRIPLQSPSATVRTIKTTALSLNELLENVSTKHPLTQTQLRSVITTIVSYRFPTESGEESLQNTPDTELLSESAILSALFGWSIVPINTEPRKSSYSRASTPGVVTPARVASTPARTSSDLSTPSRETPVKFHLGSNLFNNKRDTLLQCSLCQRRIGLWTFTTLPTVKKSTNQDNSGTPTPKKQPQLRQFDLLREHRSYCPYVVRSTAIPVLPASGSGNSPSSQIKLPASNEDVMEGWRAVLTIILRYGLGQKQIPEKDIFGPEDEGSNEKAAEATEVDGVRAMVSGVKSKGGRDLLKYVKNLLG